MLAPGPVGINQGLAATYSTDIIDSFTGIEQISNNVVILISRSSLQCVAVHSSQLLVDVGTSAYQSFDDRIMPVKSRCLQGITIEASPCCNVRVGVEKYL
jgi:hypothetical protein